MTNFFPLQFEFNNCRPRFRWGQEPLRGGYGGRRAHQVGPDPGRVGHARRGGGGREPRERGVRVGRARRVGRGCRRGRVPVHGDSGQVVGHPFVADQQVGSVVRLIIGYWLRLLMCTVFIITRGLVHPL